MDATYDRELIAEMLAAAAHGGIHLFAMDAVMGQIAALRAADNRDAAGVDADEDAYVIEHMGKLLAEIAVIVNGPEPALTRWSYHDLPDKVRALKEAPTAVPAGEAVAWRHPDEVPEVVPGGNAYFWVAVRRKHDGRVYSFPAQYLNAMLLSNEWSDDTERSGNRYHHGPTCEVEGSFPATGWHDAKEHGEYDCVYQPLLGDADELVAWREVADYPATTPPVAQVQQGALAPKVATEAPSKAEAHAAIATAISDGIKALRVLSTMLRKEKLQQGFMVADEILGSLGYAEKMNAALAAHHSACELGAVREALDHAEGRLAHYSLLNPRDTELSCAILPMVRRAKVALQHRGDSRGGEG